MASSSKNCVIVGQGAIGLLAACRLQQAGWNPSLLLKQPSSLAIHFRAADAEHHYRFLPATPPYDLLLIPVKAYDVLACIKQLAPRLSQNAQVVITHNGMPDLLALQAELTPEQGLWFLSTSHGALRNNGTLTHTGLGQSIAAPINLAARLQDAAIFAWLDQALGPLTLTDNIYPGLWQKLAINAVINPLTTLHNCPNGHLAQLHFRRQIQLLIKEFCQVADLEGIKMSTDTTLQLVLGVISRTAANYSSMQQDFIHGRPTELSAITGFLLAKAAKHGVVLPHHQQLYQALLLKGALIQGR